MLAELRGGVRQPCSQRRWVCEVVLPEEVTSRPRKNLQWSRRDVGLLPGLHGTAAPFMVVSPCWFAVRLLCWGTSAAVWARWCYDARSLAINPELI